MAREQLKTLTEPMYYMLLALVEERHGYGIMQRITEMTEGRVEVGAGTLYALLGRFEKEQIICQTREKDRKKFYRLQPKGREILSAEFKRLNQLVQDGKSFFDTDGNLLPPSGGAGPEQEEELVVEKKTQSALDGGILSQEVLHGEEDMPSQRTEGNGHQDEQPQGPRNVKGAGGRAGLPFGRRLGKGLVTT